jgi:hypothetical protein
LWRRVVTFFFLSVLVLAACSRNKENLTLVIEWQKADSDACLACKHSGTTEEDIRKAFDTLTKQLAAKGIRVELVEKKAVIDTSKPETGPGQMWLGSLPLETWLGASVDSEICPACPLGPRGHGHQRKSYTLDGQTLNQIPVDLMVRAGESAGDHLLKYGKIDPEKLPKGCSGCPSAVSCPKGKVG